MQANKTVSLTTQAFWLMVARTLGFVFSFALPLLLVRVLSQTQIGLYRQCFLLLTTAVNILPLGMHVSAFYYLAGDPERRPGAVLNVALFMGTMGLLAGTVLVIWPGVLGTIFSASQIVPFGRILGVLVFLWLLSSFLEFVATANQDVTFSTWFIILAQLTKTVLLAGGALLFRTVEAVLYAALLQGLIQTGILIWYLNRAFPRFYRRFDSVLFREQTSYAVPFGVAGLMYTAQSDFPSYLVAANVRPRDYAIYSIGTSQLPLVNLLRDSLNTVLLSRIAKLQQEDRMEEIRVLVFRSIRKVLTFYLPVWAALLLIGQELLTLMYTKSYLASWPIFAVNITLLPFNSLLSDAVLRSFPAFRFTALKIRAFVVVATIALAWFGFFHFGMIGAVTGATAGLILERTSLFALVLHVLHVQWKDFRMLGGLPSLLFSTALAFATGFGVRSLLAGFPPFVLLLCAGTAFAVVFLAAVLWLGVLEQDERDLINVSSRRFLGRDLLAPVRSKV